MTGTIFSDEPILLGDAIRHYMTDTDNQAFIALPTALDKVDDSANKTLVLTPRRSPTPMTLSDAILYIEQAYGTIDHYVASALAFEDGSIYEMSLGHLLDEGARQRTALRNKILAATGGDKEKAERAFKQKYSYSGIINATAADLIDFVQNIDTMFFPPSFSYGGI
ncbi:MAG: hypothetical protein AAF639_16275 [Chloroflexota bacterium]